MNGNTPIVSIRNLSRSFGSVQALTDISLDIQTGEFISIIGPSGCGKSTLLLLLAGLDTPTQGEIYVQGKNMDGVKPWDRHTPLVWQSVALFPHLDVRRNIEYGLKARKVPKVDRAAKVDRALELLGIEHLADRDVTKLSGGEKQRVGLARAIVTEPEILLLDEALSALDAHLRQRMQSELRTLHQSLGITFVFVTHDQSEALAMSDRIVVMNQGRIHQVGTPEEVYQYPSDEFVAGFVGINNILNGTVRDVAPDHIEVETGFGLTRVPPAPEAPAVGDEVTFVIRADEMQLSATGIEAPNSATGVIVGHEYIGASVVLRLRLKDGQELKVQTTHREFVAHELSIDGEAEAYWPSRAAHLLPRADAGLTHAG